MAKRDNDDSLSVMDRYLGCMCLANHCALVPRRQRQSCHFSLAAHSDQLIWSGSSFPLASLARVNTSGLGMSVYHICK